MASNDFFSKLNWGGGGPETQGSRLPMVRPRGRMSKSDAAEYVRARINPKLLDAHRWPMEREWVKNIAFLNGNQHFVDVGAGFRSPILEPHRVMYRANIIRTMVTRMVSTVLANTSTFRAPAKDWTKKSRDQAYVSEKLFEHLRENVLDWSDLLEDALTWAACCGTGFIEIGWDADKGDPDRFYVDEEGQTVLGLNPDQKRMAEEAGLFVDVPPGEITARSRSPLQVYWDWSARQTVDQASWMGTKELVDISELENVYGYEKTRDIKPMEARSQSMWYDEMLSFMAGGAMAGQMPAHQTPRDKMRERTTLIRYFERPMRQNKYEGRFVVMAGDVVLVNKPNPYVRSDTPLPFVKIDWQRVPGSFIGHAPVADMRNPQFQYNNARAKQTEVLNVHSHPPMFVNKNAGLPEGMLSIEPGVIYPVDMNKTGGQVVQFGPVPQVPKELAESASRAMSEIQMISSQADPDMSKLPGQIRGAPGLSMMIEEKNKSLIPAARSALRATLIAGRMMLRLARSHYTMRRTIRYVGEDNAYRVLEFEGADIQTDIRIVGEPEFFRTKAVEKAQVVEWVQAGVLNPSQDPDDKIAVLKTLAYGSAEQIIAERLADEENQDREWEEMKADPLKYLKQEEGIGQMLHYPTEPFDDDDTHVRVLTRRMKTSEFRDLDPIARQLISQHLQEHQSKIEQRRMQQMMLAMQMNSRGSAPSQPGQPSRPRQPQQGANRG
jgi:hypothetical protein